MRQFPKISVVIATFNSDRTLEKCLNSLYKQNYPKDKLEIIISDGGSTDKTKSISKKFNAKIVRVPKNRQNAEFNKGFGLKFITGEYVLCIDHDNVLPNPNWLKNMLYPLVKNDEIVATEPIRYHYDPNFSLLDRYFALFGVNDPVPYYLGKADRMDYIHENYNLIGKAEKKDSYFLVSFDKNRPNNIPTLGANGFLIRKKFLFQAQINPEKYFHIDINVDLVKKGFVKYAFVKTTIIHLTDSTILDFLKRRILFINQYYFKNLRLRRYSVYNSSDNLKLLLFILYSITFIKPILDSLRGWLKIKDIAWFIHPVMCFAVLNIYGFTFCKNIIRRLKFF
ncbi:hypothetical protein A2954_02835 [Candidatus Roizmanbacteria bacterium RIFCSPLOWO2_01_FULL_37_12]|uniref:Glycosyltransferase 2-like domain-containing protein n=1 Tax=Candidatus Roizmanbacteria bacterium RIFCSPLOWO2_01_FULL_37_12 TaxID=1802056 RepID=A0A1F7IAD6_9BACT|nr:MAG: hypothetical protein A2954_02835 [Candidatus Roizmanbacteria bacterium RIFCSPLOWO2_01_FULL_37_12]